VYRGFGGGFEGSKWEYLAERTRFVLEMPVVPEFDKASGTAEGMTILRKACTQFRPDILVASSRGGAYAAALVEEGTWTGPVFLISALHTGSICAAKARNEDNAVCVGERFSLEPFQISNLL